MHLLLLEFLHSSLLDHFNANRRYGLSYAVVNVGSAVADTDSFAKAAEDGVTLTVEVKFNIVTNTIDARDLVVSNIDPMTYTGEQLKPDLSELTDRVKEIVDKYSIIS